MPPKLNLPHSEASGSVTRGKSLPVFTTRYAFPSTEGLGESMYLGAGADLEPDTLLYAYSHGFFPWYEKPPILWCSPPQRTVLRAGELHISRSLKKALKRSNLEIRCDSSFTEVIRLCARVRPETWITDEMQSAYVKLFELGWAHSWEAYEDSRLVGGIYGVVLGRAAFLESTFHLQNNAGKIALVNMYEQLLGSGAQFFDFQVPSEIAESFGAYEVPRATFEKMLRQALV
ncbi:Leucyl/phenylalanyl-tRNA--protein transferase [Turneriella parva DSM 21527]|uniref:Leucyl/phenylalanyl-tRNA--protein transferase n=1 Tax=Turneriella parva (strain ATCC BAA-1111 / DSM 21527 / NCTC 11395 / H) TaxID=869212 RepID=I4B0L5_TURPD|nr:Leucyl/phenylalanyl-tRNA--protein transferase [Turneriella parva DSM 21527]